MVFSLWFTGTAYISEVIMFLKVIELMFRTNEAAFIAIITSANKYMKLYKIVL